MSALALSPTVGANRGAGFVTSSLQVAQRTVRKFIRTPQLLVVSTMTGILFLMIFRYVFGGAVGHLGGVDYVDFVVPGFVATGVLFTGMGSSVGVAEDIQSGLVDRLRSLPVSRLSVILGRVVADAALIAWGLFVTTAIGFLVGFRIHNGVGPALAAFGLCLVFGIAFDWLFVTGGLIAGNAQAAQGLSFLVFPLSFVSSAYVPVSTMPSWMQGFANHQPLTVMVDTVRILTQGSAATQALGHPLSSYLPWALLWSVGIVLVFAPLAVLRFRKA